MAGREPKPGYDNRTGSRRFDRVLAALIFAVILLVLWRVAFR
jgi:hypothetical protein